MTGREKDELRFVQLLQPNRDLAANWAVDVARELEHYLAELSVTSLFEDGTSSLNFAEAALLIQGSIQVYSRKVEYLYALVLQALEFIAQKKQAEQEKSSIQADGKDSDVVEEQGEEEFLNLDDIEEEANIDIDDEVQESSTLTPAAKPPASLLVLEGDAADIAGDGGELAAYQIATSSLHRDFLLLDPRDADAVDNYLNVDTAAKGTPRRRSSSAFHRTVRTPRSGVSTPGRRAGSAQKSALSKGNENSIQQPDFDDAIGSQDAPDFWEDTAADMCGRSHGQDFGNDKNDSMNEASDGVHEDICGGFAGPEYSPEDEEADPWKPLNPHEPGGLPVKPYRRGLLTRKRTVRDDKQISLALEFPLAKRFGTTFPYFTKAREIQECTGHRKQMSDSPAIYEKLRRSFSWGENSSYHAFGDPKDGDDNMDARDDAEDYGTFDDFIGASNGNFTETDIPVQPGENSNVHNLAENDGLPDHEKDLDAGASFEDLCRAHLDALLRNIAESEKQTELASRVSTWKQKIEKNLDEQDSRTPFDIHVYGERVLDKLSLSLNEECEIGREGQKSFTEIVSGQEKHEVARTFAALLQLVNNGNVALDKGISGGQAFCFTAEKPFFVTLLNSNRRHEEMLKYRAPSMAPIAASKKPCKKSRNKSPSIGQASAKIRENNINNKSLDSGGSTPNKLLNSRRKDGKRSLSNNTARLRTDHAGRYSDSSNRKIPSVGSRFTPESKRRRRLQSIRPIEIRVAR